MSAPMAAEVLPVVRRTPVLAGVNGTDPFLFTDRFLDELETMEPVEGLDAGVSSSAEATR